MSTPSRENQTGSQADALLELALQEDLGAGDVTSCALIPESAVCSASLVAVEPGILCGMPVVERLFARFDPGVQVEKRVKEGEFLKHGTVFGRLQGSARSILALERLALNLLQHLSGIATLTHRFVQAVEGTHAQILDTRKTHPGLRALEKLAVFVGGGTNHRQGLWDMILIKDNHLAMMRRLGSGGTVGDAITKARAVSSLPVQVEVDTLGQFREALEFEPEMILLDNMDATTLAEAVRLSRQVCADHNLRRPLLEASGGVTLSTVREIAASGVDRISIGALTHSARALDLRLDLDPDS